MNEKVLVVDDNDVNRRMMVDVLEQWGYRVGEADNGKAVLGMVEEFLPDLILLDVMLPGMNGYEICHRLKQDPKTDHIPIIMLTVLNDSESRTRGIGVGADLFVSRPPNYQEMHKNIESLLLNKRKYRRMESMEALCGFFEGLVRRLSTTEYERYQAAFSYALRTAKILSIDDDSCRRMMMSALCWALEGALERYGQEEPCVEDIVAPLNASSWVQRFTAFQRHPSPLADDDLTAAVYYACARFCECKEQGAENEAAFIEAHRRLAGCPARVAVVEALRQAVSDEAFLLRFSNPDGVAGEMRV